MKAPSKINLAICPSEKCFKFLDYQTNEIATYPCDIEHMDVEFFSKLETSLKECFENTFLGGVNAFSIVIPDEYYALTTISLPKLNQNLSIQNLKTELQARFQNISDMDFEFFLIAQKQDSNVYLVRYIRKSVISQFHKIFTNLKKELLGITPRGVACYKKLLSIEPKLKQRNFILVDIKEAVTYVSIYENVNMISYHKFDFGRQILSTSSVAKEESLFNHKPAQIAVIKARAAAKAKKGIPDDVADVANDEDVEFAESDSTDEFEIIMKNWDHFLKQIQIILDNDFFYKNHIKFDDILFNMPEDLHYIIDNTSLESEFDETGMEVKRKKKVVNTLERKQPYVKKPQLRKREFATFTKQDKKQIKLRTFDVKELSVNKKVK